MPLWVCFVIITDYDEGALVKLTDVIRSSY